MPLKISSGRGPQLTGGDEKQGGGLLRPAQIAGLPCCCMKNGQFEADQYTTRRTIDKVVKLRGLLDHSRDNQHRVARVEPGFGRKNQRHERVPQVWAHASQELLVAWQRIG